MAKRSTTRRYDETGHAVQVIYYPPIFPPAHIIEPTKKQPIAWVSFARYTFFDREMMSSPKYFSTEEEAKKDAAQENKGRMDPNFFQAQPVYIS